MAQHRTIEMLTARATDEHGALGTLQSAIRQLEGLVGIATVDGRTILISEFRCRLDRWIP